MNKCEIAILKALPVEKPTKVEDLFKSLDKENLQYQDDQGQINDEFKSSLMSLVARGVIYGEKRTGDLSDLGISISVDDYISIVAGKYIYRKVSDAPVAINSGVSGIPEWAIQTTWFAAGIFGTGAVWYFLSINKTEGAIISGCASFILILMAIALHVMKDRSAKSNPNTETPSFNLADEISSRYIDEPNHVRFLSALPKLKSIVIQNAKDGWDTGNSSSMKQANYDVIDFLEFAWLYLAAFYPKNQFGKSGPRSFIRNFIKDRFRFHWAKNEPNGPGTGGTIIGVIVGGDVIDDLEKMISDTVQTLFASTDGFNYQSWHSEWNSSDK